jgi:hypothetical protein
MRLATKKRKGAVESPELALPGNACFFRHGRPLGPRKRGPFKRGGPTIHEFFVQATKETRGSSPFGEDDEKTETLDSRLHRSDEKQIPFSRA